jgi:hypothetical protein
MSSIARHSTSGSSGVRRPITADASLGGSRTTSRVVTGQAQNANGMVAASFMWRDVCKAIHGKRTARNTSTYSPLWRSCLVMSRGENAWQRTQRILVRVRVEKRRLRRPSEDEG